MQSEIHAHCDGMTISLGCVYQEHRKPKLIVAPLVSMGLRCIKLTMLLGNAALVRDNLLKAIKAVVLCAFL